MLTYLICPSVHNFCKHFRKQEPELNFSLNGFFYRGDLTGKLYPNRFLKTRFLVAGFYCISQDQPLPVIQSGTKCLSVE